MKPKPGRFCVGTDIAGGPCIRLWDQPLSNGVMIDRAFAFRLTWIGCYWGVIWRNLLGPLYVPLSPTKRWELKYARKPFDG